MAQKPINYDVAKLLTAERKVPLSYQAIADRIRQKHPGAKTSPRSVASIASALRAGGLSIPDRRATRSAHAGGSPANA